MEHITEIKWNLSKISRALDITDSNTLRFLKDGRNSAFLLKFYLSNLLDWELVEGYNAPTKLISFDGSVWVIKTCTSISGVSLCQNSMIGKGRKFNAVDFLKSLNENSGFLICDIDSFPVVNVYKISSKEAKAFFDKGMLSAGRMKYSSFRNIVKSMT